MEVFGDARSWDDASYSDFLRAQRLASTRTVFAARKFPSGPSPAPAPALHDDDGDDDGDDDDDDKKELLAVASSDGSVSLYTLPGRPVSSLHQVIRFRITTYIYLICTCIYAFFPHWSSPHLWRLRVPPMVGPLPSVPFSYHRSPYYVYCGLISVSLELSS